MGRAIRRGLKFLAWPTVPLWLGPLGWWLAYHPWAVLGYAGLFLLAVQVMLVLAALVAVAVVFGAPFAAVVRAYRLRAMLAFGKALVFVASFVGGLLLGRLVWQDRVEQVVARSQPLVTAINDFTTDHGRPPETLHELKPQYLTDIPTTGIGARPDYRYAVGEPTRYDGNPWVLLVTPPCPPMGFDVLMYFPLQNYPATGHGGGVERVGTWGYVHE